jgi:DNA-binding GntR family transcriptional regulator
MDNLYNNSINEYLPLREVVFNTLRQSILMGELKPGERLMEIKLANHLGVSRTPIREAIHKLELEGLVVMIPRKGATVSKITEKDLNDVLEVRCSLEELAVELACHKITQEEITHLKQLIIEFKEAMNGEDVTYIAKKDVEFHDVIFAATNNKRLIQLISNLREQMYRYRLEYLKNYHNHGKLVQEHKEIIKNLEDGNVTEAKKNIKSHIYNQAMAVSKIINKE